MGVSQELLGKIGEYEKQGYTPDEIIMGLKQSTNYPDVSAKINIHEKDGYKPDEILQGIKTAQVVPSQPQPAQPQPSSLWDKLVNRGQTIVNTGQQVLDPTSVKIPRYPVSNILGALGGSVNDIVGAGLKSGYENIVAPAVRTVTPDVLWENWKLGAPDVAASIGSSPLVKPTLDLLKTGQQGWNWFENKAPEEAQLVKDVANVTGALPVIQGVNQATQIGKAAINEARSLLPEVADAMVNRIIDKGISQGVRPLSRAGVRTTQGVDRFQDASRELVKDIYANRGTTPIHDVSGEIVSHNLPRNAPEMLDAVDQTLKRNVKGYLSAVQRVTGKEVKVPLTKIIDDLSSFADDEVNQTMSPNAVRYAKERLKDFAILDDTGRVIGTKEFTPEQFERALQAQTSTVKRLINNPTKDIDALHVEGTVQKALRETQDATMNLYDGPEYRSFKDGYANAKQLEADVIQRARVTTRQGPYSLIDFTDVYTLPQLVGGVMSGNPAQVGHALLTKGVSKYIKWANHPDTAIRGMFDDLDRVMGRIKVEPKWTGLDKTFAEGGPTAAELEYNPAMARIVGQPYGAPNLPVPVKLWKPELTNTPILGEGTTVNLRSPLGPPLPANLTDVAQFTPWNYVPTVNIKSPPVTPLVPWEAPFSPYNPRWNDAAILRNQRMMGTGQPMQGIKPSSAITGGPIDIGGTTLHPDYGTPTQKVFVTSPEKRIIRGTEIKGMRGQELPTKEVRESFSTPDTTTYLEQERGRASLYQQARDAMIDRMNKKLGKGGN